MSYLGLKHFGGIFFSFSSQEAALSPTLSFVSSPPYLTMISGRKETGDTEFYFNPKIPPLTTLVRGILCCMNAGNHTREYGRTD